MTHIFVVSEKTFKIHLEYMFAGTGYGENVPDFINVEKDCTKADSTEKNFVSMIADISRLRFGDRVAFYVTGCKKVFGFFTVASNPFFNPNYNDYLGDNDHLGRYLPFRVFIKPDMVFCEGATEHEVLDNIYDIDHPYEMCWSLIYRKLTGMRGCSFVTDYEQSRLFYNISKLNDKPLLAEGYTYDPETQRIIPTDKTKTYVGSYDSTLDIKDRLLKITNSFECHLQAYIMQNYDKGNLKSILFAENAMRYWIGNEVICSVGEQRIDILTISLTKDYYDVRVVELKYDRPYKEIVTNQIIWYLRWVMQYVAPNINTKPIKITPVIIAAPFVKNTKRKREFYDACDEFNRHKLIPYLDSGEIQINDIEYVSFERGNDDISFTRLF